MALFLPRGVFERPGNRCPTFATRCVLYCDCIIRLTVSVASLYEIKYSSTQKQVSSCLTNGPSQLIVVVCTGWRQLIVSSKNSLLLWSGTCLYCDHRSQSCLLSCCNSTENWNFTIFLKCYKLLPFPVLCSTSVLSILFIYKLYTDAGSNTLCSVQLLDDNAMAGCGLF
jgi:hypothetical protein